MNFSLDKSLLLQPPPWSAANATVSSPGLPPLLAAPLSDAGSQAQLLLSTIAHIGTQSAILHFLTQLPRTLWANSHWWWIFLPFVYWEIRRIVWTIWWKAPKNVRIIGLPTILGRYITAIRMVVDSDAIVQKAYDEAQGKPFAVPMLDRYLVFISDRQEAARLEQNTPACLSEIEALHELASTDQVLQGVKISTDRYFHDGAGALKKHLRSNLPALSSEIQTRVNEAFEIEFQNSPACKPEGASDDEEWRKVNLVPALLRMITRVNVPIFVGRELGSQEEILDNLMSFFWSCLNTLFLITFIPNFLVPFAVPILMGLGLSKWKLYDTILSLAHSSVDSTQNNGEKEFHLVQWVSDMMKIPDAIEIAKTSLGLVFGSAFQIPMVTQATIYHLCTYRDYLPSLRAEALENEGKPFNNTQKDLPLLDSFVKETARLSPGLILSVPRRVMSTYISPDEIVVPEGNWLAVPQYTMMRDPEIWAGGKEFNGYRFVDENGNSTSRWTHPSHEFPYWGSIKHACPARFYAAVIVKTIVTRMLCHYEFRLEKPQIRLFFSFGMIRLTNPFMNLLVRERRVEA